MIFIFFSCSASPKNSGPNQKAPVATNSIPDTLTLEQQSAFDALNILQVSSDEMNRIYSTFPNITQPCYPSDTSFVISQLQLLEAMEEFVSVHCKNLSVKKRKELVETSVIAQESYVVNYCTGNLQHPNYENGPPLAGIWVIPNILGRRDLTLVW